MMRREYGLAPLLSLLWFCASGLPASAATAPKTLPATSTTPYSVSLEVAGYAGGTSMSGRPLLGRAAYSLSSVFSYGNEHWTYVAIGVDGFTVRESYPDPSLFLYRGFGGNSLFVEGGARFALADLGLEKLKPLAKGRLEVLGGAGLAATEDTGTTLVSLLPFLRLDARMVCPIDANWSWTAGIPLEVMKKATALTGLGGLSVGIVWTPRAGGTRK